MDADALAAGPLTSTRAAQVAVLVLVVALVVPLFFLSRMASNRPPDPSALKNVPRVRKDKADASGGGGKKGKAKKGAMERMRSDAAKGEGEEEDTATAGTAADGASDDDDEDDAKATRAAQRREAARERAEQREAEREFQDAKAATRRQKDEAREAKQEAKEEAARQAKAEEAARQAKEYEAWKGLISVDEAGTDAAEGGRDESSLLSEFVSYIQAHKVLVLEDLAAAFELRVQDAIARVRALEELGHISGVVDDRGKFIYVSKEEMQSVAAFITKRGRVSIRALAAESNRLIDLNSKKVAADTAGLALDDEA